MAAMSAARVSLLIVAAVSGCATTRIDPGLYDQKTFAIASVFARKDIGFANVGGPPSLYGNALGDEVLEMELGETEVRLGEIFGAQMVPPGKALDKRKAYGNLPEVSDPEDYTRVNDMTAVDTDAATAAPALGALAQALGVDAVVVLSHEWTLARDRFEVTGGVTAYDRCSVVVVDARGRRLWDDDFVVQVPATQLDQLGVGVGLGFNGATWADAARQLARRTSRAALDAVEHRYREGRKLKAAGP